MRTQLQRRYSRGDIAEASSRGLRWRNSRLDRKFDEQLQNLSRGEHGVRAVVDARATATELPCWLHLHALSPIRVLGVFGDQPLVLATLFHPQHFKELDLLALGDLFGMTPTEAKVATFVAAGLDANEMALRLRTKVSTIRTHLRQVFAKIGAKRMTDAVRLLQQGDALWAQPRHPAA
jgi:DNA-binding CsgD family transcriptional regulator